MSKTESAKPDTSVSFRTSIGGQALIEGILMRGPTRQAIVCRTQDGMVEKVEELHWVREKHPILGWPLIRGVIVFLDSMVKGMKALTYSADLLPEDEQEEPGKIDLWIEKHFGEEKAKDIIIGTAVVLGIALSIGVNERLRGSEELHFNSQAALFMQSVKEMKRLIRLLGGRESALDLGAGDLYVTVYGGRTRRIGILLGRGLSFGEAMEALAGVTLESVVVATRVARAVRVRAARGELSLEDFPLLMHVDEIINRGAAVDIPWDKFTAEDFAE